MQKQGRGGRRPASWDKNSRREEIDRGGRERQRNKQRSGGGGGRKTGREEKRKEREKQRVEQTDRERELHPFKSECSEHAQEMILGATCEDISCQNPNGGRTDCRSKILQ